MRGMGGTAIKADGRVYEGEWKDNEAHGHGKMTYADGGVHEGKWKGDERHGQRRYTRATRGVAEGIWQHGKLDLKCQDCQVSFILASQCKFESRRCCWCLDKDETGLCGGDESSRNAIRRAAGEDRVDNRN